jgi:hypothetical protein
MSKNGKPKYFYVKRIDCDHKKKLASHPKKK